MSYGYFEAESHVSTYNKFRPSPPKALIERIVEYTSENFTEPLDLAVDIGCGSGQSTEVLAPYFKKVLGIDPSPEIIKEARKKCQHTNVFYSICSAEKMDMEDEIVDVLTTCQAIHWLHLPKFYSEAKRILKPKGCFAVYGYHLPEPIYENNEELKSIIKKYYEDVLADYTLPQSRQVYLENYTSKEYNEIYFIDGEKMQREENFLLDIESDVNDSIGYITSWSAFQNYVKQEGEENGTKLLKTFKEEFNSLLGEAGKNKKFKMRFNYFLLLGRKKQQQ